MKHKQILRICNDLINKMESINSTDIPYIVEKINKNQNYAQLQKEHFPIYHAIILKKINHSNIHILKQMLSQKHQVDTNQISMETATNNVTTLLCTECNLDINSLNPKNNPSINNPSKDT